MASTCVSPTCGVVAKDGAKRCPRCGAPTFSPRAIRIQGSVLLVLSVVLLGLLGSVAVQIWPLLSGREVPGGPTFSGTREQAETGLTLMVGATALAVGMGAMGLVQVVTGRRRRWLTLAVFAMVVGFVLLVRYGRAHI